MSSRVLIIASKAAHVAFWLLACVGICVVVTWIVRMAVPS